MYEKYLEKSKYVDYDNESVYKLAIDLKNNCSHDANIIPS